MSFKTFAIASVLAVSASVGVAHAGVIVPAGFVQGTLTAIDVAKNTVSVDGTTYAVDRAIDLQNTTTVGDDVTLTLMVVDGKSRALWVEPVTTGDEDMTAAE